MNDIQQQLAQVRGLMQRMDFGPLIEANLLTPAKVDVLLWRPANHPPACTGYEPAKEFDGKICRNCWWSNPGTTCGDPCCVLGGDMADHVLFLFLKEMVTLSELIELGEQMNGLLTQLGNTSHVETGQDVIPPFVNPWLLYPN